MYNKVFVGACANGRGLFANKSFKDRELIIGLTGHRHTRNHPIHQLDEGANLLQTGPKSYILLKAPAVFANHSCNPNAGVFGNRRLIALREIEKGEEICFDYSTTMEEEFWTLRCSCGDPACRGLITDFHLLPDHIRAKYLKLGVVQGFISRRDPLKKMIRTGTHY